MFPAAHSFFGVVTHTYLASTSSGLNVVATSRPNIGLKVATLRPMFRFGKVTHTYLASKSPGLNVAWPQRRLASMSPGLNVAWPQCRGLNVAGLNVAWPQCPIVTSPSSPSPSSSPSSHPFLMCGEKAFWFISGIKLKAISRTTYIYNG